MNKILLDSVPSGLAIFTVLLGYSSIKTTEKYYAPWVRTRREQLEADVRRSWEGSLPHGLQPDGVSVAVAV